MSRAVSLHDVSPAEIHRVVGRQGCLLLCGAIEPDQLGWIRQEVEDLLREGTDSGDLLSRGGVVYAVRNLLDHRPVLAKVLVQLALEPVLAELVAPHWRLVRLQYLDKPVAAGWSLPWHRDRAIAIEDPVPARESPGLSRKAGVWHVTAPPGVLRDMLAIRLHLDDVDGFNGPLEVVPGSHDGPDEMMRFDQPPAHRRSRRIECRAGDILLMRPLLLHRSGSPSGGQTRSRRVLHYEVGPPEPGLPGVRWRWNWHP